MGARVSLAPGSRGVRLEIAGDERLEIITSLLDHN